MRLTMLSIQHPGRKGGTIFLGKPANWTEKSAIADQSSYQKVKVWFVILALMASNQLGRELRYRLDTPFGTKRRGYPPSRPDRSNGFPGDRVRQCRKACAFYAIWLR